MSVATAKWKSRAHAYCLLSKRDASAAAKFRKRFTRLDKLDAAIAAERGALRTSK